MREKLIELVERWNTNLLQSPQCAAELKLVIDQQDETLIEESITSAATPEPAAGEPIG